LEEQSSVLLESPLGILTLIEKGYSFSIEETPNSFDVYGKLLAIESNAKPTSQSISRLFVSQHHVFKCNKEIPQSAKSLLPEHSDTLRLLKEITNLISQNQRSHIITSPGKIGIIFEDVKAPSKTNIEGYEMLPRLIDKVPNIFQ
jgi:hypothetical protein